MSQKDVSHPEIMLKFYDNEDKYKARLKTKELQMLYSDERDNLERKKWRS